jgi:hypothetical protein
MFGRLGQTGAYLVWIALFILLGGRALSGLVAGQLSLMRFYALFSAAFFAYGAGWMASYFTLKGLAGQWLGAVSGPVAMAVVFAAGFRALRSAPIFSALLFVAHSIGFFLGSFFYYTWGRPAGLMIWGAFYGACLGAGIGGVIYLARYRRAPLQQPGHPESAAGVRHGSGAPPERVTNTGPENSDLR